MKYQVRYEANIDYVATIDKTRKQSINPRFGGGRNTKGGESPEAQMILDLKDLDMRILITHKGLIQIWYTSLPKLRKAFRILEKCLVPHGEKLVLKAKGPDDPLDLSFETTTIEHMQHSDVRLVKAKIPVYVFRHLKTGDFIYETLDRDGNVHVPSANHKVDPNDLEHGLKETPYRLEDHFNVGVYAIDKFDEEERKIITGERLIWKAIQEVTRVLSEHGKVF
jgi:hypothetical protein